MTAPHVAALYRYPVKGLTPEPAPRLTVLANGTVEGDRVLGLLLGDIGPSLRDGWWPKRAFVTLMTTPGAAHLTAHLDHEARRLTLSLADRPLAEAGLDDEREREALALAVTEFVRGLEQGPRRRRLDLPLRLVGDGRRPRFHDRVAGQITLLSRASIRALEAALDAPVDERRFRGNVVLEGLEAWEEDQWPGRELTIGSRRFRVTRPVVRCQAVQANPDLGEWDLPLLQTLVAVSGQARPTLGVLAEVRDGPVSIGVGDAVEVAEG